MSIKGKIRTARENVNAAYENIDESPAEALRRLDGGLRGLTMARGELAYHVRKVGDAEVEGAIVTVEAHELRSNWHIRARGATGWSTIRCLTDDGGAVVAHFDWGRIAYNHDDRIEIPEADLKVDGEPPEEVEAK